MNSYSEKEQNTCAKHICAKCAEKYGSCCVSKSVNFDKIFPIADIEIELIKTKQSIKIIEVENNAVFQNIFFSLFPKKKDIIKEKFKLGSKRKCLAINADGSCQFLTETGCILEREIRPTYCKLFPFWLIDDQVTNFCNDDCLATRTLQNINTLLEQLNSSEAEAKQLFYKLEQMWLT